MKVFKCEKCGKMLMTMADSGCIPHCCGEEMTLLKANTTDGALEKQGPREAVLPELIGTAAAVSSCRKIS